MSPAGVGASAFSEGLQLGQSFMTPLGLPALEPLHIPLAGRCAIASDKKIDRFAQLALAAAIEAVSEARLSVDPTRVAVIIGTASGGIISIDEGYHATLVEQRSRPSPFTVPKTMASAPVSAIAAHFGFRGLSFGISSACASGSHAIGLGMWLVRQGLVDTAIVGGAEAPLATGNLRAWSALRALSPTTCRPFSRTRNGTALGEGAAVFVLERHETATARGVTPWGEVAGFGSSSGGVELTRPNLDSFTAAMHAALGDAGVAANEIDYVQAHGTGTPLNDGCEAAALHRVLGPRAEAVPTSSIKGAIGHTIGASGALSLGAILLGMRHGFIPPTVGHDERDPEIRLDIVANQARRASFRTALCNSFAFGDLDTCLVVRAL